MGLLPDFRTNVFIRTKCNEIVTLLEAKQVY